jgi:hypothetical protein
VRGNETETKAGRLGQCGVVCTLVYVAVMAILGMSLAGARGGSYFSGKPLIVLLKESNEEYSSDLVAWKQVHPTPLVARWRVKEQQRIAAAKKGK